MWMLLILLLFLCIVDIYKNKKLLSPRFLFNFIFFLSCSLYKWDLSYLQQKISNRTEFILLTCVISFNVVYSLAKLIFKKVKIDNKKKRLNNESIEKRIKIAKYIAIGVFFVELIYSKGCPLLWKFTSDPRTYFDFGIPSLNGAFYGLIICLGAYSIFTKSKDKYIYLLMGIMMISRQVIMSIIIEGLVFYLMSSTKKINFKKILIFGIAIFIGFTFIGNFRSGNDTMTNAFYAKRQYKKLPDSAKWTYSYMTFSISNFNNLVSMTKGNVNHGASMLSELMPTVILNKVHIKQNFDKSFIISSSYNVSTYLPCIYLDFGIVGIAIFNMLIAFLGYFLYKNATEKKSDKDILLYAVFAHNIILLFFINMFLYLPIIIQFVYIPIIFGNMKRNKKKLKEA